MPRSCSESKNSVRKVIVKHVNAILIRATLLFYQFAIGKIMNTQLGAEIHIIEVHSHPSVIESVPAIHKIPPSVKWVLNNSF